MLRIAILEDDLLFRQKLYKKLENIFFQAEINVTILEYTAGEELIAAYQKKGDFHVVFFDVELPGISGIETAKKLYTVDPTCLFFFITHLHGAVYEVFDVHAYNFICKERFEKEVDGKLADMVATLTSFRSKYQFSNGYTSIFLSSYDIFLMKLENRKITLYHKGGSFETNLRAFTELPFSWEENNFFKIQRTLAVNMHHIKSYDKDCVYLDQNFSYTIPLMLSLNAMGYFKKKYLNFRLKEGNRFDF